MKIKIVAVGKCREPYAKDGVAEYVKRISKFASTEIVEVADEKTEEGASEAQNDIIRSKEGKRILSHLSDRDYCIALSIRGDRYTSEAFSAHIEELMNKGEGSIAFVIGGSVGLSDEVLKRCDERLSFSDFTFPHQLMRVILLEQVYRAFKIMKHEPYHK